MRFVSELQRRNVTKVCVLYVVVGWLLVQFVGMATQAIAVPDWVMEITVILLLIGFPVAVIFSWVYEITPHGLKLEADVEPGKSITPQTGKRIDRLILIGLFVAIGLLAARWLSS